MTDPIDDVLTPSEATDPDELGTDEGDQVVDPPEDWQGVDKFGMTESEAAEGESLDDKLAAEEPDV